MVLYRALSPPTLHQRPNGDHKANAKGCTALCQTLGQFHCCFPWCHIAPTRPARRTSAFNPDAALCSAAPTPASRCRLLLSPSSYFQPPALSTHSPSSRRQLLCQMGWQMRPHHTQHGPAGVHVLLGSLSTKPQHRCSYSSCRDRCLEPMGLGGTAGTQIWLFWLSSCMYTTLLAMSAHTGAGCADLKPCVPTPEPHQQQEQPPVCIPTPETRRTAQPPCRTAPPSSSPQSPHAAGSLPHSL